MTQKKTLSIHIQLADGRQVGAGIHEQNGCVVAVDEKISLMVLTRSSVENEQPIALTAAEILIDDMQTNLSPGKNATAECLRESIDNIHEYLYEQQRECVVSREAAATAMAVVQYWNGRIFCMVTREFDCLLLQAGELVKLVSKNVSSGLPGENATFDTSIQDHDVLPGDVVLMARSTDIKTIGQDFVRMTLSRFSDNLDVALRQINQKASRKGLEFPPVLILTRIEKNPTPPSWVDKLRKS